MIRSNQVWAFLILALVYIVGVPFIVESRYILGILASAAGLSIIALGAWLTLAIGRVQSVPSCAPSTRTLWRGPACAWR